MIWVILVIGMMKMICSNLGDQSDLSDQSDLNGPSNLNDQNDL